MGDSVAVGSALRSRALLVGAAASTSRGTAVADLRVELLLTGTAVADTDAESGLYIALLYFCMRALQAVEEDKFPSLKVEFA